MVPHVSEFGGERSQSISAGQSASFGECCIAENNEQLVPLCAMSHFVWVLFPVAKLLGRQAPRSALLEFLGNHCHDLLALRLD
jgi:hypothetical protein